LAYVIASKEALEIPFSEFIYTKIIG